MSPFALTHVRVLCVHAGNLECAKTKLKVGGVALDLSKSMGAGHAVPSHCSPLGVLLSAEGVESIPLSHLQ